MQMRTDIAAASDRAGGRLEGSQIGDARAEHETGLETLQDAATEPMPEVEAAFPRSRSMRPGSGSSWAPNDSPSCSLPVRRFTEAGIRYEVRVMSAHRDPEKVRDYCHAARMRGLQVIIAGAGMSAALPGVAAAHTDLRDRRADPRQEPRGLDALRIGGQMPPACRSPASPSTERRTRGSSRFG